jgi:putative spermidine/putrescine transport system permease protein
MTLAAEVTLLCVTIAAFPAYLALRTHTESWGAKLLVAAAVLSLLTPTIARSLAFASLFAYYGPLATFLRDAGLWPQGQPLDSSHAAVVASLVTLYLPVTLLVLSHGARQLGRSPEIAATLGASRLHRFFRIVIPGMSRPAITAALIVFSQAVGVIVTPRILGNDDITLAILIDDLMKRSLDTEAAARVALAELLIAVPVAVQAARYLDTSALKRVISIKTGSTTLRSLGATVPFAFVLLAPVMVLIALSLSSSPLLSLEPMAGKHVTLEWYRSVLDDRAWRDVVAPSLLVWMTASVLSIPAALLLALAALRSASLRSVLRWVSLTILFVPQNALGLAMFVGISAIPGHLVEWMPAWIVGGIGQAVPGFAIAYVLLDGVLHRTRASIRIAATLGASWIQRTRRVLLPQITPTLIGCLVAAALVSLDDVIFVRYLPRTELSTFSTELLARARFTASPEVAAACALLWLSVLSIGALVPLLKTAPSLRLMARRLRPPQIVRP